MRIRLRTTLAGPALTAGPATSSPSHPHWALVVTAPAARPGLTTVAMAKRELGITGSADHDFLEDLILQASAAIEGWCRDPSVVYRKGSKVDR